uniref:Uncharacterized protein n=1 Tax=Oryzias melastigma TaxID=30732 RepID=A0A3B3C8W7_ORYME
MVHLISSAEKLTMVGMKFSLIMMERICFQSVVLSPKSKQMDSRASLTAAGGLAMERTSTRCCFLIDLTAINIKRMWVMTLTLIVNCIQRELMFKNKS